MNERWVDDSTMGIVGMNFAALAATVQRLLHTVTRQFIPPPLCGIVAQYIGVPMLPKLNLDYVTEEEDAEVARLRSTQTHRGCELVVIE